jgi:hypothetical protein
MDTSSLPRSPVAGVAYVSNPGRLSHGSIRQAVLSESTGPAESRVLCPPSEVE